MAENNAVVRVYDPHTETELTSKNSRVWGST
jgi:hypothetical protein